MSSLKEVFVEEYLNKLNSIKFNGNKSYTGSFSGNRRSKSKGSSLEFSDFRNYTLGDDIRRIDWNSYGRLDKLFVRVFEEERQANINIFIDISSSMDYGEKNKLFFSKVVAASMAYIAFSSADNVNIFTLNNKIELNIKNASTKNMLNKIINFLDDIKANGETDIDNAFEDVSRYRLRPGLSVLISDFLTDKGYEKAILSLLYKKQKVCLMHVLSEEEMEPSLTGGVRLVDAEDGSALDLEVDEFIIEAYKKELNDHINKIETFSKNRGVEYVLSPSNSAYYQYLGKLLI